MLEAISLLARRELAAALESRLNVPPTAAERHVVELGALAQMLSPLTPAPHWDYPTVTQAEYDDRRPDGAPSGELLADRFGGWTRACEAAYGLKPDGRYLGPGRPWPYPLRGKPRAHRYSHEEVVHAVRRCALELACRPSSTTYIRWSGAKRLLGRQQGRVVTVPTIYAVYRQFPRKPPAGMARWQLAVAAATITDDDLRAAFAQRMRIEAVQLTIADEIDEQTVARLRAAGLTDESIELLQQGEAGKLRLSQAVIAARALGCSLDYLTRRAAERGTPPAAELRFDHIAYARRRKELGVQAEAVRQALRLNPRDARRLALGTYEPTLDQLATIEQLLSASIPGLRTTVAHRG